VTDVDAGTVDAFLGTGLPDVVAQHLPGGVDDEVGRGVVAHRLVAPGRVDLAADELALPGSSLVVDDDAVVELDGGHLAGDVVGRQRPVVCGLPTAFGVEHRLVQDDVEAAVLAVETSRTTASNSMRFWSS